MNDFLKRLAGLLTGGITAVSFTAVSFGEEPWEDTSRQSVPNTAAMAFVNDMGAGINLGNTFDACNCTWLTDKMDYETGWQRAKTTKEIIDVYRDAGFKTMRIPVSWHEHTDEKNNIDQEWLERVKQVVDWALDDGMYVILNTHHDYSDGYYASSAKYSASVKWLEAVWQQVAEEFKDYDEKLIFETMNEPRLTNTGFEWWFDTNNVPDEVQDSLDCINKYNQLCVDTIRAAGGKNKERYILIPGYDTAPDARGVFSSYFKMPKDSAKDKLLLDVHYYGVGKAASKKILNELYESFVKNGIPVVVTEYGLNEGGYKYFSLEDTAAGLMGEYYAYARSRGITVVAWDINSDDMKDEKRTQFIDRNNVKVALPKIVNAMVEGGTPAKLSGKDSAKADPDAKIKVKASPAKTKIKLSWNKTEGAKKYAVYQYIDGKYKAVASKLKTNTYTVTGLKSGTKYKFVVRAYVNGKWISSSAVAAKTK